MTNLIVGNTNYGTRSVVQQAKLLQQVAQQHPVFFQAPELLVHFSAGVTAEVRAALEICNIKVESPLSIVEDKSVREMTLLPLPSVVGALAPVNLDVTALVALCSSVCQPGGALFQFDNEILDAMAKQERTAPALPSLQAFLKDRQLILCACAEREFVSILKTVAGAEEQARAQKLLSVVTRVPNTPSSRAQSLRLTRAIKHRNLTIFGTGDQLQCVTLTANRSFVRAAQDQAVDFVVHFHDARAFTEKKQQ